MKALQIRRRAVLILSILLITVGAVSAQNVDLQGVVVDVTGLPIIGATVVPTGLPGGTTTDIDGNFTISVPSETETLTVSFIGFKSELLTIADTRKFNVTLIEDMTMLQDVVVTGYTSQKKADLTGAVAVVDMDDLHKQPESNAIKGLQGRIPGVKISPDASPSGGGTTINIRGVGTLNNNDPLYIIDGVPTKSGLHEINSNDIASIQVLKDASSASIYGSRASNGVIIITTKQGKGGKININFSGYSSISSYTNRQEVLNAEQFGEVLWQASINSGIDPNSNNLMYQFDTGSNSGGQPVLNSVIIPEYLDADQTMKSADTDWFDEISQIGVVQSYDLSISSGSDKGSHLFSLSYYDNQGIIKHTEFNRMTARLNGNYKFLEDKLIIGENLTLSKTSEVSDENNILDVALRALPIIPVHTVDGIGWGGPVGGMNDRHNPVRLLEDNKENSSNLLRVFGNAYAEIAILDNLKFKSSLGIDYESRYQRYLQLSYSSGYLYNDKSAVNIDQEHNSKLTWSNILTNNFDLKKNHFDILLGTEIYKETNTIFGLRSEDFTIETPDYMYPDVATGATQTSGSSTGYSLASIFAKVDYRFDERYLFSATVRRDGSSRFAEGNKWGVFPAFSAGWRVSEEEFAQELIPSVSSLKLRFGWGQTGNQEIDNNSVYSLYVADYSGGDPTWASPTGTAYDFDGTGTGILPSGFKMTQLENNDLKWETTTQTNIGADFSMFDNTLYGTLDYYFKETTDILVLPPYLGAIGEGGNRWVNGATMQNSGVEFSIGYRGKTKSGITYDLLGNISSNRNEITHLPQEVQNSYGGDGEDDNILGHSINSTYGYVADGIFKTEEQLNSSAEQDGKALGRIQYRDLDNNNVIDDDDRTWIGSPHPKFTYGLNGNMAYKKWSFSFFFEGSGKIDVLNERKAQTDFWSVDDIGSNKGTRLLNAWSPENSDSDIPALTTLDSNSESRSSSYYIENGKYLKLRTVQVGYEFTKEQLEKVKLDKMRLYLSGQNLLTFKSSDFTGVDPENPAFGYPLPLTVTVGLNITL